MAEKDIKGHVRPRGTKLEIVVWVDGRRITRTTGLTVGQEADAEEILAATLDELRRAGEAPPKAGTLREWGERWIEDRKTRGKLEWIYERGHLAHFVYPLFGDRALSSITDVEMLDWARGLERQKGPSGKHPAPKYVRKITATVRAMFKEATRRHLIEKTPCIWDDSDLPELEANSRVVGAGFELAEVARLIYDPRIREDRRVQYALEFLTGMRPGEVAARHWRDIADESYRGDLGRIIAGTAYNTRHRVLKTTKTRVEKWIPIHPALADVLKAWREGGWERFTGRQPTPDDLIVPSVAGKPRNNAYTWRCFRDDLVKLGIPHQRHYETRSTFINLAEGAGALPEDVHRLTHASIGEAKDLYRRIPQQWGRLCAAVKAIKIGPPPEVSQSVSQSPSEQEGRGEIPEVPPWVTDSPENGRARESNAHAIAADREVSDADSGDSRRSLDAEGAASRCSPLPDATADFVEAAGRLAAAAVARKDHAEARRLLEAALRACDAVTPGAGLRIVRAPR